MEQVLVRVCPFLLPGLGGDYIPGAALGSCCASQTACAREGHPVNSGNLRGKTGFGLLRIILQGQEITLAVAGRGHFPEVIRSAISFFLSVNTSRDLSNWVLKHCRKRLDKAKGQEGHKSSHGHSSFGLFSFFSEVELGCLFTFSWHLCTRQCGFSLTALLKLLNILMFRSSSQPELIVLTSFASAKFYQLWNLWCLDFSAQRSHFSQIPCFALGFHGWM